VPGIKGGAGAKRPRKTHISDEEKLAGLHHRISTVVYRIDAETMDKVHGCINDAMKVYDQLGRPGAIGRRVDEFPVEKLQEIAAAMENVNANGGITTRRLENLSEMMYPVVADLDVCRDVLTKMRSNLLCRFGRAYTTEHHRITAADEARLPNCFSTAKVADPCHFRGRKWQTPATFRESPPRTGGGEKWQTPATFDPHQL